MMKQAERQQRAGSVSTNELAGSNRDKNCFVDSSDTSTKLFRLLDSEYDSRCQIREELHIAETRIVLQAKSNFHAALIRQECGNYCRLEFTNRACIISNQLLEVFLLANKFVHLQNGAEKVVQQAKLAMLYDIEEVQEQLKRCTHLVHCVRWARFKSNPLNAMD